MTCRSAPWLPLRGSPHSEWPTRRARGRAAVSYTHLYRYLVNPALAAATILAGGYGGNREFTIAPTGLEAGSYKVYKVDGGRVEKNHTLQVGDYFLADGNLLSKDAAAEMVAQAEVAGIVFQTAPSRIGEGEKNALGGEAHGLVLAAKNAATNVQWGPVSYTHLSGSVRREPARAGR